MWAPMFFTKKKIEKINYNIINKKYTQRLKITLLNPSIQTPTDSIIQPPCLSSRPHLISLKCLRSPSICPRQRCLVRGSWDISVSNNFVDHISPLGDATVIEFGAHVVIVESCWLGYMWAG